eukprot:7193010-Prymnesium_polylepis.2
MDRGCPSTRRGCPSTRKGVRRAPDAVGRTHATRQHVQHGNMATHATQHAGVRTPRGEMVTTASARGTVGSSVSRMQSSSTDKSMLLSAFETPVCKAREAHTRCVSVCVCEREGERENEREQGAKRTVRVEMREQMRARGQMHGDEEIKPNASG